MVPVTGAEQNAKSNQKGSIPDRRLRGDEAGGQQLTPDCGRRLPRRPAPSSPKEGRFDRENSVMTAVLKRPPDVLMIKAAPPSCQARKHTLHKGDAHGRKPAQTLHGIQHGNVGKAQLCAGRQRRHRRQRALSSRERTSASAPRSPVPATGGRAAERVPWCIVPSFFRLFIRSFARLRRFRFFPPGGRKCGRAGRRRPAPVS